MANAVFKVFVILLLSTLYACGGGGSSSRSASEPAAPTGPPASPVSVSGVITFDRVHQRTAGNGLDYNHITADPARGVTVELINSAGLVQGATVTSETGKYQIQVPGNTNLRLQAKAEMISAAQAAWDVRVTDNTAGNALYLIRGSLVNTGSADSTRNLHAASGWSASVAGYTQPRSAAPFAILDVIYDGIELFASIDPTINLPPLELRWSTANTTASGQLTDGDIGTSFYTASESAIYLVGSANNDTDEYDRHIIAHEWGHYVEDKLSKSDSIGGPHSTGDRLDMRVAFSEGFGYALAGIVLQDSIVRDSFGLSQGNGFVFDVESNQQSSPGWYSEASVQSILYDIADADVDPDGTDQIALGLAPIYNVMTSGEYRTSSALATVYLFITELHRQYPEHFTEIAALTSPQLISGSDEWGTGETNSAGQAGVLPVYRSATIAAGQTLCTISEFNSVLEPSANKLGNSVFIRYPGVSSGEYTINVARTSGAPTTSPEVSVYRNGNYIFDILSNVNSGISWSGNLSGGDYVLVLSEADTRPACYNFVLSNN